MLASDASLAHLSDSAYLLHRAGEAQERCPPSSKAWLITAQALYPRDFGVQFEIYKIVKASQDIKSAAKCLGKLIAEFPLEGLLFLEISSLMAAVQASSSLSDQDFPVAEEQRDQAQIFSALNPEIQRGLILSAAERTTDTLSQCSLLMLLTSLFPETTELQAPNLVETLLSADKLQTTPLNRFRKTLICSVLPSLIGHHGGAPPSPTPPPCTVPPPMLHHLLLLALEYYSAQLYSAPASKSEELTASCIWASVFSVLRDVGSQLDWKMAQYFTPSANREVILQRVQAAQKSGGEENLSEQLYVVTTLFLHALYHYCSSIDESHGAALTLVEGFTAPSSASRLRSLSACDEGGFASPQAPHSSSQPLKKRRLSTDIGALSAPNSSAAPHISVGKVEGRSLVGVGQALATAIKCWDLINANPATRNDFVGLLSRLPLGPAVQVFTMDMLLHEARLGEAQRSLSGMLAQGGLEQSQIFSRLELFLKLASVNYFMNDYSAAAKAAVNCVSLLPPKPAEGVEAPPNPLVHQAVNGERHLHLLSGGRADVLQYSVTMLINCLLARTNQSKAGDSRTNQSKAGGDAAARAANQGKASSDAALGYLATLIQFHWPEHEPLLHQLTALVARQGGLTYDLFSTYVVVPEIIEEFCHLHSREGGHLALDLLPGGTHVPKQQRTRGQDRGSKNDFKQAMRKQISKCNQPIGELLVCFINAEGQNIVQALA